MVSNFELEQVVRMLEGVATVDFNSLPNMRFAVDLRKSLMGLGLLSETMVDKVISQADINLSEYDSENPLFQRLIKAYSEIVKKSFLSLSAHFTNPLDFASKMKLEIKL